MARPHKDQLSYYLSLPDSLVQTDVQEAITRAIASIGGSTVLRQEEQLPGPHRVISSELARSDCLVADLSFKSPIVYFEYGVAQAMGKQIFVLIDKSQANDAPLWAIKDSPFIFYEADNPITLQRLTRSVARLLDDSRKSPRRTRIGATPRAILPFFVDFDKLESAELDNLCRELFMQLGFQRVEWIQNFKGIDLIAELPKKDPDGFEYKELWFVSLGKNGLDYHLYELAMSDPEFLLHTVLTQNDSLARTISAARNAGPITFLFIAPQENRFSNTIEHASKLKRRPPFRTTERLFRIRSWDRDYITSLVHQFPHLGFKYFSDEGRARSQFRKSPEALYKDNVELTERLAITNAVLRNERHKRVRAERDAIWKDISFAAAHRLGNPIFAIETNISPLKKRVEEHRTADALKVVSEIETSVDKAKDLVDQFKSLARAQELAPVLSRLRPLLSNACAAAGTHGIACSVECDDDTELLIDPNRLRECIEELAANTIQWAGTSSTPQIAISVLKHGSFPLPSALDSTKQYTLIRFSDNGPGIPTINKNRIFDAFFTTRDHGTGLGLALVRRVIEGHNGIIVETGQPGKGAVFEIYIPSGIQDDVPQSTTEDNAARSNSKERQ